MNYMCNLNKYYAQQMLYINSLTRIHRASYRIHMWINNYMYVVYTMYMFITYIDLSEKEHQFIFELVTMPRLWPHIYQVLFRPLLVICWRSAKKKP